MWACAIQLYGEKSLRFGAGHQAINLMPALRIKQGVSSHLGNGATATVVDERCLIAAALLAMPFPEGVHVLRVSIVSFCNTARVVASGCAIIPLLVDCFARTNLLSRLVDAGHKSPTPSIIPQVDSTVKANTNQFSKMLVSFAQLVVFCLDFPLTSTK